MIKQVIYKFIQRLRYDDIIGYAAQISFYLLVSLFPFLILFMSILQHIPIIDPNSIFDMLAQSYFIPQSALKLIRQSLDSEDIVMPSGSIPFYVLIVLWFASRGIRAMMNAIHNTFRTRDSRSLLKHFLNSFIYTFVFIGIILGLLAIIVYGEHAADYLASKSHMNILVKILSFALRFLIPIAIMYVIINYVYRTVPTKELSRKDVMPGTLIALIGGLIVSSIFSLFTVQVTGYSALYGGISSVIILCTWMYILSFMLVIGSEINACLYEVRNNTTLISIH